MRIVAVPAATAAPRLVGRGAPVRTGAAIGDTGRTEMVIERLSGVAGGR